MILKNDVDVLDKIQELFSDCLRNREFGEFTVSLTMNHGGLLGCRNQSVKILFGMNRKRF